MINFQRLDYQLLYKHKRHCIGIRSNIRYGVGHNPSGRGRGTVGGLAFSPGSCRRAAPRPVMLANIRQHLLNEGVHASSTAGRVEKDIWRCVYVCYRIHVSTCSHDFTPERSEYCRFYAFGLALRDSDKLFGAFSRRHFQTHLWKYNVRFLDSNHTKVYSWRKNLQ